MNEGSDLYALLVYFPDEPEYHQHHNIQPTMVLRVLERAPASATTTPPIKLQHKWISKVFPLPVLVVMELSSFVWYIIPFRAGSFGLVVLPLLSILGRLLIVAVVTNVRLNVAKHIPSSALPPNFFSTSILDVNF
uniref:Uncharacterized protein n=1 Tax=Cyclophora tenuis TaxID=216820 RepID=A0A7S1GIR7_CYCTE